MTLTLLILFFAFCVGGAVSAMVVMLGGPFWLAVMLGTIGGGVAAIMVAKP